MESGYGKPGPPRYVMLSEATHSLKPPPGRRNLPRYYSRKDGGGCGPCACVCLVCCLLLLLFLLFVGAVAIYVMVVIDPQAPSYHVSHFGVGVFDLRPDLSLYTEFNVAVRAENPNAQIGIAYGDGGMVAVLFKDARLCAGNLPVFFQGHRNTTTINVVLKGESTMGSGMQQALLENRHTGSIPLDIYVKVPVVLQLRGAWDLRKMTVFVKCSLVVDSLSPKKKVNIKSAHYKFNVEL
ncbi:hypothetical protein Taro_013375 [Colocasia esculenta]|uniref:Late embryogenesis abundant protein LEA-2 subgroup domain-containing protein n=1 Tax=Colocasia esculenta TaxID=4460 RepID=A0A843UBU7_COLES|nr:hypothetical protein [Colocasia esculenta]